MNLGVVSTFGVAWLMRVLHVVVWWFVWSVVVLCLGAEAHPGGSNWQCKETGASAKPPRQLHAGAGAPSGNARLFMMCVCVPGSAVPGVFSAAGLFLSALDMLGRVMGRLLESITGVVLV